MMILGFIATIFCGVGLIWFAAAANTVSWPDPNVWIVSVCGVIALITGIGGTIFSMAKNDWLG